MHRERVVGEPMSKTDTEIRIRSAKAEDANALGHIHINAWRKAYKSFVPPEFLDSLDPVARGEKFSYAIINSRQEIYVAEKVGIPVGFMIIGSCEESDLAGQSFGEIQAIYLDPDYWRIGIGRKLVRFGENLLSERGMHRYVLWAFRDNSGGRRFYEALGYRCDGTSRIISRGRDLEIIRFQKRQ